MLDSQALYALISIFKYKLIGLLDGCMTSLIDYSDDLRESCLSFLFLSHQTCHVKELRRAQFVLQKLVLSVKCELLCDFSNIIYISISDVFTVSRGWSFL